MRNPTLSGLCKVIQGSSKSQDYRAALEAFEELEDVMVPYDGYAVMSERADEKNERIKAFNATHNLTLFRTEAAAEAYCRKLNDQQREEHRTHPWWGPYEKTGLIYSYRPITEAMFRYALQAARREKSEAKS